MLPPRIDTKAVRERIGSYADAKISPEERAAIYEDLLGFVPPRIEARINAVPVPMHLRLDTMRAEPTRIEGETWWSRGVS